eukprot:g32994.t1
MAKPTQFNVIPERDQLAGIERELRFHEVRCERPNVLSDHEIEQFNRDGYLTGIPVFSTEEMEAHRRYFDELLARVIAEGGDSYSISTAHLKYGRVYDLLSHSRIVEYVSDLLGENVVGWGSHYFCKMPGDGKAVAWHQDCSYWPLTPSKAVTVWLAIDDADRENACMRFLPGSHRHGLIPFRDSTDEEGNVLDQTVENPEQYGGPPVDVLLPAGEMSIHSDLLLHGSDANHSDRRRCGLTLRYCPADRRTVTSFLLAPENPVRVAAIRIGLGAVLLFDAVMHWPYVVELYSSDGMPMPMLPGSVIEPHAFSAGVTVVLFSIMLFALLSVVVGWQTRLSLLIALVLTATIGLLDPPGTFKKYSVIALHVLLLLACSRSAAVASVDAWVNNEPGRLIQLTPVWPRRLMQVLISSVYLGAVITKIRLPDFASGDLIMFSLLDERWGGNWLGMWLAMQPKLLMFISYGTVILELAGALLLWVPSTRLPMMVILMLFHASIGLSMHVGIFSPTMIVVLLAFSKPGDLERLRQFASHILKRDLWKPRRSTTAPPLPELVDPVTTRRRKMLSVATYVGAMALFCGVGYLQQSVVDYTGVFQGEVADEWEYLPEEMIQELDAPRKPHPADHFHRIEIGSRLGFLQTFGEHQVFKRGSTIQIVARLTQNHPELELEWILQPPGGLDPVSQKQTLARGFTYTTRGFRLDREEHPTGTYTVIVKANGKLLNAELDRYIAEVVPTLPDSAAFYQDRSRPETLKQMQHMGCDEFFEQYRGNPAWKELANALIGEPADAQQPEWFNKPPGTEHPTPPHQDNFYFCLKPPNVATLWLALDVVDGENGCLRYVAGSHAHGVRPHGPTEVLGFSQGISDFNDNDRQAERAIHLQPGDLVVHHGNTIHRAEPNRSADRQRRAFAMVFRGESVRRDVEAYARYEEAYKKQHEMMGLKTGA